MFTTITRTATPAGVIEVRVRHIDDDGDGALLGFFPPDIVQQLPELLVGDGVYFSVEHDGPFDKEYSTQFVVEDGRVYYEIIIEG